MTKTEHLAAIRATCVANLAYLDLCAKGGAHITKSDTLARQGWETTIVAIDALADRERAGCPFSRKLLDTIIAQWPVEPLITDGYGEPCEGRR